MARRVRAGAGGLPRRETRRQPGVGRSRASRTTTPPRGPAARSRGSRCLPEGRQIAPLVGLAERVLVVGGVACVHLGGTIPGEQRSQGLVYQSGVGDPSAGAPGAVEKARIHGRAQSYSVHATSMLHLRRRGARGVTVADGCWHDARGAGCAPEVPPCSAATSVKERHVPGKRATWSSEGPGPTGRGR